MHGISQVCAFGGFVQKKFHHHPQITQILQVKAIFRAKHIQTLVEMPPKFVFKQETAHGNFKFGVKNLTQSRIMAVSAHAQQKIG